MFGFIIGTACLIGFISVWKRGSRRHFRRYAWWIFRKLDASPGQERVIRNAIETVKREARNFAAEGNRATHELADLLRDTNFDRQLVNDWFMAREEKFQRVRQAAIEALGDVHEVLDDGQRDKLAGFIERGPYWRRVCGDYGPYRSQVPEAS